MLFPPLLINDTSFPPPARLMSLLPLNLQVLHLISWQSGQVTVVWESTCPELRPAVPSDPRPRRFKRRCGDSWQQGATATGGPLRPLR